MMEKRVFGPSQTKISRATHKLSIHFHRFCSAKVLRFSVFSNESSVRHVFKRLSLPVWTNSAADGILADFYTSLNSQNLPGSELTPENFLQAWISEQNYPEVTIEFTPANGTESNTTIVFRQTRHLVSHEFDSTNLNPNYVWPIYMECQFGGTFDGAFLNATGNVEDAGSFVFENETLTLEIPK